MSCALRHNCWALLHDNLGFLPLSERPGAKKRYDAGINWDAYVRYLNRTRILILFPPIVYEKLPTELKRMIFLEFLMYVFDPTKRSDGKGQTGEEAGMSGRQSGEFVSERRTTGQT
jgi:hypothetical protein